MAVPRTASAAESQADQTTVRHIAAGMEGDQSARCRGARSARLPSRSPCYTCAVLPHACSRLAAARLLLLRGVPSRVGVGFWARVPAALLTCTCSGSRSAAARSSALLARAGGLAAARRLSDSVSGFDVLRKVLLADGGVLPSHNWRGSGSMAGARLRGGRWRRPPPGRPGELPTA